MADAHAWLPAADLLTWLKVTAGSDNANTAELCRVAAARVIERNRPELKLEELTDPADAPDDVQLGGVLLAARLYARDGSPQGIATFGELGASTILRSDPDIGQLVGVGRWAKPRAR